MILYYMTLPRIWQLLCRLLLLLLLYANLLINVGTRVFSCIMPACSCANMLWVTTGHKWWVHVWDMQGVVRTVKTSCVVLSAKWHSVLVTSVHMFNLSLINCPRCPGNHFIIVHPFTCPLQRAQQLFVLEWTSWCSAISQQMNCWTCSYYSCFFV